MSQNDNWSFQLDWLNIIKLLGFISINQIPESKKQKAVKRITKLYGNELLQSKNPNELDAIVVNELKSLMKREIIDNRRREEKLEKEVRTKMHPLKKGRIIGFNLSDLRDLDPNADPEEVIKYFSKKLLNEDDDDDTEDEDEPDEDKSGIYI